MKFSVNWLKQWVRLELNAPALAARLTASGLEVDSLQPVAADFSGVVVAEIEACVPHPDASKLSVCTVNDGSPARLQVVCGAPNARAGLRAPLARVGATLGAGNSIGKARLRGVDSAGMLCSARELGLSEDHSGLMELPPGAPLGQDLRSWLELDDHSIEIDLTPNRADCLSIRGLARDVAASCAAEFLDHEIPAVPAAGDDRLAIRLNDPVDCPRYAGRIVRGLDPAAATPHWMKETLRRCGLRSISPVVDVTNFVMLELGQPMHAFDLDRIDREIIVRRGRAGEALVLLDGSKVDLDETVLAICDAGGPIALAGIMGGQDSAVTAATRSVLLESAWFRPAAIMGKARALGMHTDASHRFERGVDPCGQARAVERATALLLEICGGQAGPLLLAEAPEHLPRQRPVRLRLERLRRLSGIEFARPEVEGILSRLGMDIAADTQGWTVTAPSARVDIAIEEDLVEEVMRIHGYDRIPEASPGGVVAVGNAASSRVSLLQVRESLCAAGYQEAINYSFVDRRLLQAFQLDGQALPLANPLSADMDVMRTALVPGLLKALDHNLRRQQGRVRLFETGTAYLQAETLTETARLAAVASGSALPEQWGSAARPLDFFDIKGDVECLLALGREANVRFLPLEAPFAHPGKSAAIERAGIALGWCGALHPAVLKALDIPCEVFAFELDLDLLLERKVPLAGALSRFPSIRRDLAFWTPEAVSFAQIEQCVLAAAGELLQNSFVFDVYQDSESKKGYKSLAIGLILQNVSSTLTDKEADTIVQRVVADLEQRLGARLRG